MRKVVRTCPRCHEKRAARYRPIVDRHLCPECCDEVAAGAPLDLDRATSDPDVTVTSDATDPSVRYYGRSDGRPE